MENLGIEFSRKVGLETVTEMNKKKKEGEEKKIFRMMLEFSRDLAPDENYSIFSFSTKEFNFHMVFRANFEGCRAVFGGKLQKCQTGNYS